MSSEFYDTSLSQIRETITRLQTKIEDFDALLPLLCAPLDALGLLPPKLRQYNTAPFPTEFTFDRYRHLPPLQRSILEHIVPTWFDALKERRLNILLEQYFCPDVFSSARPAAGDAALIAYNELLSAPLSDFSVNQLIRLTTTYPIDRQYGFIFAKSSEIKAHRRPLIWEDCVRNVGAIPTKVANFLEGKDIPEELQHGPYFTRLCVRFEILLFSLSTRIDPDIISSISTLLSKMINLGLFPATTQIFDSNLNPSFFSSNLPTMRTRLSTSPDAERMKYSNTWNDLWSSLPSKQLDTVLASIFSNLTELPDDLDPSNASRGIVKRESSVLCKVVGNLDWSDDEKWQAVASILLMHNWNEAKARIMVCWAALSDDRTVGARALETLLSKTVYVWTSPQHIRHSLLSQHHYLSSLLLFTISNSPPNALPVQELAFSQPFISSIGTYISHLDQSVRRCGMLVAEYVAKRTGKKLDFGDWDGDSDGKPWARKVRALLESRDVEAVEAEHDIVRLEMQVDAELPIENAGKMEANTTVTSKNMKEIQNSTDEHDSDDSLTGYASDGDSSRSPSPTPSELAEIEKDPMLNVGKKKVAKPVYLADLGGMLRSTAKPDDPQEADRIEVAITCAEELIRKKKGFGLELEENAVNLVYGLLALNNNFELDDFDAKRQGALNALVACCPQRAPPAIIEEFFKNQYSTEQRFAMLNALALGARELASLPIPPSTVPKERTAFPSRRLPPALHQKYLPDSAEDSGGRVRALVDDISQLAIDKGKEATEDKVPAFVRERQLRIKQPSRINEISLRNQELSARNTPKRETTFTDVAAEYFLGPLVARFWLFLRDEQTREARTAHRTHSYRGTGTGLILNPMVLAQLLGTTTVLVHAARHAPAFLAVLAPDALELALTLGTRPLSTAEEDKEREAAVLTACLELAVVVIDACLELDGGRSLGLEHTALVVGSGEWAGEVLGLLDKGARVQGGGGVQEVKLKRAAAGVVIKVDELTSRWRPSMISVG